MGTARRWFDGRAVLYYVEGSAKVWGLFVLLQINTFLLLAGSRDAARSKSAQKKGPAQLGPFCQVVTRFWVTKRVRRAAKERCGLRRGLSPKAGSAGTSVC